MREIKFKAWHKERKIILIAYVIDQTGNGAGAYAHPDGCRGYNPKTMEQYRFEYTDVEWLQFTGLKDKNGKEIYEGDVVAIYPENKKEYGKQATFWIDTDITLWGTEYDWQLISGYFCTTHIMERDGSNREVIGNIYENADLLK